MKSHCTLNVIESVSSHVSEDINFHIFFFFPSFHNETRENYLIKNSNTKLDRARQLDGIHIREDWFTTTVRCSGGSRSGSSLDHSATAAFV